MKKGPVILITTLITVAIFLLGMQYGKHVEKSNKIITFLLSITPSPSPILKRDNLLTFEKYSHKGCGIIFTKPVQFKASKDSTLGAILKNDTQIIAFECPKEQIARLEESEKPTATTSVILNNKNIQGYKEGENIRFIADHPYKKTPIIFSIDNNLLPLIQSSLEFIK